MEYNTYLQIEDFFSQCAYGIIQKVSWREIILKSSFGDKVGNYEKYFNSDLMVLFYLYS